MPLGAAKLFQHPPIKLKSFSLFNPKLVMMRPSLFKTSISLRTSRTPIFSTRSKRNRQKRNQKNKRNYSPYHSHYYLFFHQSPITNHQSPITNHPFFNDGASSASSDDYLS
jgi:hypothetical protein